MADAMLQLDQPEPLSDYLGCGQSPVHVSAQEAHQRFEHTRKLPEPSNHTGAPEQGKNVRAIRYNMYGFSVQRVGRYCEFASVARASPRQAETPSVIISSLSLGIKKTRASLPNARANY